MIEHSLNLSPKATNAASRSSSKALDEKSYEREDVPRSLMRQRPYAAKAEHIHGTESLSPLLERRMQGAPDCSGRDPRPGAGQGVSLRCAVFWRCPAHRCRHWPRFSRLDYARGCGTDAGQPVNSRASAMLVCAHAPI